MFFYIDPDKASNRVPREILKRALMKKAYQRYINVYINLIVDIYEGAQESGVCMEKLRI